MKRTIPWLVVPVLAALMSRLDGAAPAGDLELFARAGRTLEPFANPDVQAGPLQVYAVSLLDALGSLAALDVLGALALLAVGHCVGLRGWPLLVVGGAAAGLGVFHDVYVYGHPAQLAVPLLWLLAARAARERGAVPAGALVALSAGVETWGALGVAVLALTPTWRDAARAAATQAATTVLVFAPFVAGFRMLEYDWEVGTGTLVSHLVEPGTPFGWPLRLAQAILAVAVGALVARRLREHAAAIWVVPLAVVVARLALDPVNNPWYWDAPITLALVGGGLFVTARNRPLLRLPARGARPSPQRV